MDVAEWLAGLGLGQYAAAFEAENVDLSVASTLSDQDLKDLGVRTLGHRRKILLEAASLESASAQPATVPAQQPTTIPSKVARDGAERRPITVMFCDLVGSTSMAAKLDPEDWRDLVGAYLDDASNAVTQYGGYVLKKLGDGLMALFGYPKAQENDAERAARAGLGILRAIEELNTRNGARGLPALAARIGLETGAVVVDSTGEIFGDAPNVAARVQSAAEPGSLWVTAAVQRQVAGLFVAEDKGLHELKGVSGKPRLYRLVRASGGGRRATGRVLTPLVGRDEELTQLARRWESAKAGEGQFVQIVGEPGLGKSRLIEEFRARLAVSPHTWVEWSCSQLLQMTPLHPIAEWGRQRFGGADVAPDKRIAELEATLAQVGLNPAEFAPLLAPLLDIPLPEARRPKIAPEELRRQQLSAHVAWLLAGARQQPVVLAFEDLHWADPTSLDLMKLLAERGAQAPLLIVATARPEFRAPWATRSHHSVLSVSPLHRAEIVKMIGAIAERHALSSEAVDGLTHRTGGVPLFIEEVTRLLLEGGVQTIPPTLQQSLAARLDRVGAAREVAQIGAVLGRDFSYGLLLAVADVLSSALDSALGKLVEADLLFVEGTGPQSSYRFKHALIQDAAYESLLKSRRRFLHSRAAEVLVATSGPQPELVAHHYTQSNQTELAIEWWGKAGDAALRRSAFHEAIAHLGKAIEMTDKTGGVSNQEQKLHVAYGNALVQTRGHGARETTEAFARARKSASAGANVPEQLAADYGLWVGSLVRGELPLMRTHAETFLRDVEAKRDSPEAGIAHRTAGITHWFAGEYRDAREHLERALALFQPGRDDELAFRFGQDAGVTVMLCLAFALWPLGDVGRAVSLIADAEARCVTLADVGTRAFGANVAGLLAVMLGDSSRVARNAAELARLTREHDLAEWRTRALFLEGLAVAQDSAGGGGLEAMRRGVDLLRERNVLLYDGLVKIAFAQAEARGGDIDRAIDVLDEALATCGRVGHRAFEAELHRARGEMLLVRDPANPIAAEGSLRTAIVVARSQAAASFELRAAVALARLYQSTGRRIEAHAVLAQALERFSQTPETEEIVEAQTLLQVPA